MAKSSFVLYIKYKEHIDLLSVEEKAALLDAIFDYAAGKEVNLEGGTKIVFSFIRQQMDEDNAKYNEVCEKRKAAGSKGGEAKANNAKQNVANIVNVANATNGLANVANASFAKNELANDSKAKQTVANVADNDNEYDNDNDKKNNIPPKSPQGEKDAETLIAEKGFSPEVEESVRDWIKYKKEKRQGYKSQGLKSLLSEIKNNVDAYGDQAVIDVIRKSMSANYQGITWNWLKNMPRAKPKIVEMPPNEPEEPEMSDEEWATMVATSDVFGS